MRWSCRLRNGAARRGLVNSNGEPADRKEGPLPEERLRNRARATLSRAPIAHDRRHRPADPAVGRARRLWIARRPIATDSSNANSSAAESRRATSSTASGCAPSRSAIWSSATRAGRPHRPLRADPDPNQVERQRRGLSSRRPRRPASRPAGHGKVSWGQIDKLLPPPTDKPFQLPDFVARRRRQQHCPGDAVRSVGIALQGAGNLSGGFKGRMAAASPQPGPRQLRDPRV